MSISAHRNSIYTWIEETKRFELRSRYPSSRPRGHFSTRRGKRGYIKHGVKWNMNFIFKWKGFKHIFSEKQHVCSILPETNFAFHTAPFSPTLFKFQQNCVLIWDNFYFPHMKYGKYWLHLQKINYCKISRFRTFNT
jgi:hypothetical protein